jgi:probable F420-dependent oxidoreductase
VTLEFGLSLPTSVADGADPVAFARRAEELGFDFVSASDHPEGSDPTNETWTMLAFVAAATSRIRIATKVLGVPYRPPPMVAKMAETLDRLSGGRLILGLGGGSADGEHRALGLGVRSPREKTEGLEEAVRIVRGLWTEPAFTFSGRHYHTEAARLEPKPARPIPIWFGTFAPRALELTGRLADGWIPSLGYAGQDRLAPMLATVRDSARNAGRHPARLTYALNLEVFVGGRGSGDGDVVSGPPGTIHARLAELAGLGFTAFNFLTSGPDHAERLATEVLPGLRCA